MQMRAIEELVHEAVRVHQTEMCGELSADAILAAVVALEVARSGVGVQRGKALEYKPADHASVKDFVDQYPDLHATATDIYRSVYHRDPSAAEARSAAGVLRDLGMASARSNGRTLWRHGT